MLRTRDGSIRGSIKLIESLKTRKAKGKKNKDGKGEDWTWKELADMVKYTKVSKLVLYPFFLIIKKLYVNNFFYDNFLLIFL